MQALSGSLRLLRLNLRLDRIRTPIWLLTLVGIVALTISELSRTYGTLEKQIAYASATAPSVVTRLLGGAITGPSLGEIIIIETFLLVVLISALLNIFMVTRHNRHREEAGQSELISSMLVGRQANLTATLVQAVAINALISGLLFVVFINNNLPWQGSLAYSLALGSIGLFFAGVSAIASQLFENARTANSFAGLVFGVSFFIRGIGDALGSVNQDGVSVTTSWLSWLSPLGWATNMLPFNNERWSVLGLYALLIVAVISLAYFLLAKRDVGSSIFATKPGKPDASKGLLKEFGLIWHLNKTAFIAWLLSFAFIGAALGAIANEFVHLIEDNEEMQQLLAALGQADSVSDLMFTATFTITGITLSAYAVQMLLRLRSEETSGRLEMLLSGRISRSRLLLRTTLFSAITATVILFATGLSAGLAYGVIDGDILNKTIRMGASILVHIPAIMVILSLSMLAFAIKPRLANLIGWGVLAVCLIVFQLGALLNLPQLIMNLSPFSHTPAAPASSINFEPLIYLSVISVALMITAFTIFKRRDLVTE